MQDESSPRSEISSRRLAYGATAIVCSFAVTFFFYEFGCEMLPALAISFFCLALVFSRWRIFSILVTLAVFYAILFGGVDLQAITLTRLTTRGGQEIEGRIVNDDGRQVVIRDASGLNYQVSSTQITKRQAIATGTMPKSLLVFLSLVLLACVFRFSASLPADQSSRMLTSRWNYTPVPRQSTGFPFSYRAELISLMLLSAAFGISAWLCSNLDQQLRIGPQKIGLIPEAYFSVKTVLLIAVLVGLSRSALSYLSMLADGGNLASLHLRRELWKSNGSEERRIARQMKTNFYRRGDGEP